jgi:hypothetical protein
MIHGFQERVKTSLAEVEILKEKCEKYVSYFFICICIYLFIGLYRYSEISVLYFFEG